MFSGSLVFISHHHLSSFIKEEISLWKMSAWAWSLRKQYLSVNRARPAHHLIYLMISTSTNLLLYLYSSVLFTFEKFIQPILEKTKFSTYNGARTILVNNDLNVDVTFCHLIKLLFSIQKFPSILCINAKYKLFSHLNVLRLNIKKKQKN